MWQKPVLVYQKEKNQKLSRNTRRLCHGLIEIRLITSDAKVLRVMIPIGISFVPPELQQPATISEEYPLPDIAPAADEEQQDDSNKKKMKGGLPKGSTDAHYEELKQKNILATNYASIKFSEVNTLSASANLKRGVLDSIIKEAKTKFNLQVNYMINKETV